MSICPGTPITWATGKFSTVSAKTRIPEPTIAGITNGKVMVRNIFVNGAPCRLAASSRSGFISDNAEWTIRNV